MPRTLKSQDCISHYRVVGPLGTGGMGEVYRAQDLSLERDVALKVLPPELVVSEERVRRFVLEAKSASSLNHPHIVTIYEIGHDRVHSGDGGAQPEPDSAPLHFISMELVSGKTLSSKIHQEKTDLRTLLGWLAQAAEGLAKAHAAGIVHRDVKPGNIMVTHDGFAKVLDFGLAKLTERQSAAADLTAASTMTEGTSEGAVLGTVGYMAPEQVQGRPVDPRSDIFSFGCILYEAATRRRPFAAESKVETMHQILHLTPAPIDEFNKEAPAELRRLIRRCLAKDPNQRLDSMKTLALELREIVEDFDALSASASSGSGKWMAERSAKPQRSVLPRIGGLIALSAAVLSIGWLLWARPWRTDSSNTGPPMEWRQLSFSGSARSGDISPDGNSVVYVTRGSDSNLHLLVQDVGGGEPIEIFRGTSYLTPFWTGVGNEVLVSGVSADSTKGIWLVPRMGGQPRGLPKYGTSAPHGRISPDGTFLAQIHPVWRRILITHLPSGDTTSLPLEPKFTWLQNADWSPDGKKLLFVVSDEIHASIWTVRLDDPHHQHKVCENSELIEARWAPTEQAIYCIQKPARKGELVKIYLNRDGSLARRAARVLISDPNLSSSAFGVSRDGRRLFCTRNSQYSNLWVWNPPRSRREAPGSAKQITQGSAVIESPVLSPDGQYVAYLSDRGGASNVHVLSFADGSDRQLTFFDHDASSIVWAPDASSLAFVARDGDTVRVWHEAVTGGLPTPFKSTTASEYANLAWAPGPHLLYQRPGNRNFHIFDLQTQTGRPLISNDSLGWMFVPSWSPDGRHVAVWWNRPGNVGIWVVSIDDTAQKRLLAPTRFRRFVWDGDGSGILMVTDESILRIGFPSGDTATLLRIPTESSRGDLFSADVMPDLRRIVYTAGASKADVWLVENFDPEARGSGPVR